MTISYYFQIYLVNVLSAYMLGTLPGASTTSLNPKKSGS